MGFAPTVDLQPQACVAELGDAELRYLETILTFLFCWTPLYAEVTPVFPIVEGMQLCITVKRLVCLELTTSMRCRLWAWLGERQDTGL